MLGGPRQQCSLTKSSHQRPRVREDISQLIVDNGDNDGQFLYEYFANSTKNDNTTLCVASWIGNMRCDAQNNLPACYYDGGDCCLKTCMDNCVRANYSVSQCPCRQYKFDCQDPNATCYKCNLAHGQCLP